MKVTILFLKLGHLYMPIKISQDGVCLLKLYYRLTEYHEFRGHLTLRTRTFSLAQMGQDIFIDAFSLYLRC